MYFKANEKKEENKRKGKEEGRKETMLSVRCDGRIGASRAAESIRATTFLRPVAQEKEQ